MKKVWIYARVSTIDKQDLETQLLLLKEYAKQRWRDIYNIYTDKISGSKEKRPWLDMLMDDAFKRKFDVVLVFRFDRMSRSTKHLITTLEQFKSLWIDFVSYQENIDTGTSIWQILFTLIWAFAEFERNVLRERVVAWLDRARQQWTKLWRPKKRVNTDLVVSLREEWLSLQKIADRIWVWKSSIGRILAGV